MTVYNITNPTLDTLTAQQRSLAGQYASYLDNPDGFDFSTAPTGLQQFKLKGDNNNFQIDWDQLAKAAKDKTDAKAATDAAAANAAALTKQQSDAATAATAAAAARSAQIDAAKTSGNADITSALSRLGVDPSAYSGDIAKSLDSYINGVSNGSPVTVDGKSIANSIFNDATTADRTRLNNEASSKFGVNYSKNLIGDNLLDPIINDIIGTQKNDAQEYLDRGLKRGIYNDIGYNAAEGKLGDETSAGQSKLFSIGSDVLDKYRTKADAVRDSAYAGASAYTPGSTFNLDDYLQQGQGIAGDANKYARGDILSTLGDTKFFDTGTLGNTAGAAQGAQNLVDSDLFGAIAARKKADSESRGLGAQGAY